MSFSPKVKIITDGGKIKAVMVRQGYHPRGRNYKKRFRWVLTDYEVEEQSQEKHRKRSK